MVVWYGRCPGQVLSLGYLKLNFLGFKPNFGKESQLKFNSMLFQVSEVAVKWRSPIQSSSPIIARRDRMGTSTFNAVWLLSWMKLKSGLFKKIFFGPQT